VTARYRPAGQVSASARMRVNSVWITSLRTFAGFYASARDDCLGAVFASVGDRQEAGELVAEAFARAWARWAAVSRYPAPRAWVVRTAPRTRTLWRWGRPGRPAFPRGAAILMPGHYLIIVIVAVLLAVRIAYGLVRARRGMSNR
jgi:hypothetical protein